ncbi:MAG: glycosyltransferase, partial [Actinomycetales bacterium]|nr:glycosyltransferase [Actinomycetales bacterium]
MSQVTAAASSVTAVVVSAADSPYLPTTLAALAAQTHQPDEILLVSLSAATPATAATFDGLVRDAGIGAHLVRLVGASGSTTFGDAVRRALADRGSPSERTAPDGEAAPDGDSPPQQPAGRWLWLLHDDAAPEPAALAELARTVEVGRSIAIAGAKQVDWDVPDRLISVGVRNTPDGQRFTGIEDGEIDQGQHDGREDVYAVGTAGMLVDAHVWDELGGPDPVLGPFLDGRDLSRRARLAGHRVVVVPTAVVRHARAGYFGLREADGSRTRAALAPDPRRTFRARREAILHARMTQVPALAVPLIAIAAILSSPIRALWRVATKEIGLAAEEFWAPLGALVRTGAVLRARRRAAATRTMSNRRLRPLQASWRDVYRVRRDLRLQVAAERRAARAPSELEMAERAAVATRRRLTLGAILLVVSVLSLLTIAPAAFSGALTGGALLPVDSTFGGIWRAALSPWVATGDGAAGPPDPFLGVLGLLSLLTGGSVGAGMQVTIALLLVLAMPLAALTGWFAAGAATRSMMLRAWAAFIWALGPALLLGLGHGRLGSVIAHVALPFVALGLARALGLDRRDVVVSGMVGAQRVAPRRPSNTRLSAREAKRARLAELAAVAQASARPEPDPLEPDPLEPDPLEPDPLEPEAA